MRITPIGLRAANAYILENHRHHKSSRGHKFSIALTEGDEILGVAIVGRPVARNSDDGLTAEVVRLCTTGVPNGCSMLYGACWRAAKGMGYDRLITFILESEPGTSLRAAGWRFDGVSRGGTWSRDSRQRDDKHPLEAKARWVVP